MSRGSFTPYPDNVTNDDFPSGTTHCIVSLSGTQTKVTRKKGNISNDTDSIEAYAQL